MNTVTAELFMGPINADRMSYFPTDYQTYDIFIDTATAADLEVIEQWPINAAVQIKMNSWPKDLMERLTAIRRERRKTLFMVAKKF